VHHVPGDLGPLLVGQDPVFRRGADRAVPHRPGAGVAAQRVMGVPEPTGEAAEVPAAVRPQSGFEVSGVTVSDDDVGVGVLLGPAGAVEVADQPGEVVPARADLPDHLSGPLSVSGPGTGDAIGAGPGRRTAGPVAGRPGTGPGGARTRSGSAAPPRSLRADPRSGR
jgi:hypothetical protein